METMEMLEAPIVESGGESEQQQESTQQQPDVNAQRQADKDYAAYIKGLREDDANGKFARRVKDDYSRLQAISKIDPKGIDGIRSRYEALNGIAHGDKTGIEAVGLIQEKLAESQATLDAIAQGDIKSLSEDQMDGVLKMAPGLIDHLAESNPEAYSALLLPHFIDGLKSSALYSSLNGMLAALNQKPPSWLTKEQLPQWTLEHVQNITGHAQQMDQWFKAQDALVQQLGGKETNVPRGTAGEGGAEAKSGTSAAKGWTNSDFYEKTLKPEYYAYAEKEFEKELRPWAEKLAKAGIRISKEKKEDIANQWLGKVNEAAQKNHDYTDSMARYGKQRNPDKASVLSIVRKEINTHSKTSLEGLIRRDYGQVLDKRTSVRPAGQQNGNGTKPAPQSGVRFVSVKPNRESIMPGFKRPIDWIYDEKWKLRDGSIVQYRP